MENQPGNPLQRPTVPLNIQTREKEYWKGKEKLGKGQELDLLSESDLRHPRDYSPAF